MRTVVSPSKPHFLKPIRPGFMNGIDIPESFSRFSGTGESFSGEARLTTVGGREWTVEIDSGLLTYGWKAFARDNKLKVNDFVVFQLIGKMKFKVYVFDGVTQCGPFPHEQDVADKSVLFSTSVKKDKVEKLDEEYTENPPRSFRIKVQASYRRALNVPGPFARKNGFFEKRLVLLRDEKHKDWPVRLNSRNANRRRMRMYSGWTKFATAQKFKEGDHLQFDLIENGKTPILRVTCISLN